MQLMGKLRLWSSGFVQQIYSINNISHITSMNDNTKPTQTCSIHNTLRQHWRSNDKTLDLRLFLNWSITSYYYWLNTSSRACDHKLKGNYALKTNKHFILCTFRYHHNLRKVAVELQANILDHAHTDGKRCLDKCQVFLHLSCFCSHAWVIPPQPMMTKNVKKSVLCDKLVFVNHLRSLLRFLSLFQELIVTHF